MTKDEAAKLLAEFYMDMWNNNFSINVLGVNIPIREFDKLDLKGAAQEILGDE